MPAIEPDVAFRHLGGHERQALQPIRPRDLLEPLITLAKEATLANRRLAFNRLRDRDLVTKLFAELGPRYAKRNGGYLRVLKAGFRFGDAAPMAVIEFIERDTAAKGQDSGPSAEPAEQQEAA